MKLIKSIPFYPFLLVMFFCLHGLVENYGYINLFQTISTGLYILLFVATFFMFAYFLSRSVSFSGIVTFLLSLIYLFFGAIKDALKFIPFLNSYIKLVPFLIIVSILLLLVIKKYKIIQPKIQFYLNLLLIIYCIIDMCNLIVTTIYFKNPKLILNKSINYSVIKQKPNVYFLLCDEYAGYKSLSDSLNFKNDFFYNSLMNMSFNNLPIHSNYFYTPYSMSSIFNMQYIPEENKSHFITSKQIQKRTREVKNGLIFTIFDSMGYCIKNYSFFDVLQNNNIGSSPFLPSHSQILTNKILHNRLIKDLGWKMMVKGNEVPFMQKLFLDDFPSYNLKVEKGLISTLNQKDSPQFVYAHFLLPHNPYLYDSLGNPTSLSSHFTSTDLELSTAYLSYLKYANNKILNLISKIIVADPSAIIILMSDHGRKEYGNKNTNDPAPFNNICFVKNNSYKEPLFNTEFSSVNFFRKFFNKYYNQQLPFLVDSSIYLEDSIK